MSTQTDIIKMLKKKATYKAIEKELEVSPNSISKASKVLKTQIKRDEKLAKELKAIERQKKSERIALSNSLSSIPTKNGVVDPATRSKNSDKNDTIRPLFININKFKTWLTQLDRTKYHGTSLAVIKRHQDHKRPGLLDGTVDLMNEYLEGV